MCSKTLATLSHLLIARPDTPRHSAIAYIWGNLLKKDDLFRQVKEIICFRAYTIYYGSFVNET